MSDAKKTENIPTKESQENPREGRRPLCAECTGVKIQQINAVAWDVPMRSPYRSAQRITTTARNVLVTVTLDEGIVGYGESAPATYVTGETQESVVAALQAAIAAVGSAGVGSAGEWMARFAPHLLATPGAFSALSMALIDAEARLKGVPFYKRLGVEAGLPVLLSRATDISLPILSPEEAGARAAQAVRDGFRAIKIKVGGGSAVEDAARVRAIAEAAPEVTLRLDGNQGFVPEAAVDFFEGLGDLVPRIEMFEQPTKAGDDAAMGFVAQRIPVPVFADESVHSVEDARRLVGSGTCGGVVLKLAKADPATAVTIGRTTYHAGGKCLFGCMMESHIAVAAALHVAVALGSKIVPMLDLDGHLLTNDAGLVQGGFTQTGDQLVISEGTAGLGITLP